MLGPLYSLYINCITYMKNIRYFPLRCDQIHGSLIVVNFHIANPARQIQIETPGSGHIR